MALAFRFDSITVNGGGRIVVTYTFGTVPLPVTPSGAGTSFSSRQEAVAVKNATIAHFDEDLMLAVRDAERKREAAERAEVKVEVLKFQKEAQ